MITKNTLLNFAEPFYRKAHNLNTIAAATLCLVGGLLASSNGWAQEPSNEAAQAASSQVAVLEPTNQKLDPTQLSEPAAPVDTSPEPAVSTDPLPAPVQSASASQIDLTLVQDLASIIDEARKQAQTEYLAEKLRKSPQSLQQYVELAWAEASRRPELRPELLIAIMHKESTFRPKVQSRYGAQGLMQVVRRWHREKLHASESLFDPVVNVRVGTDVLEEYLEWADGDLSKALAKYSGNARGYAKTVISESRKLAQVAEMAAITAAQVAFSPGLFEPMSAQRAG